MDLEWTTTRESSVCRFTACFEKSEQPDGYRLYAKLRILTAHSLPSVALPRLDRLAVPPRPDLIRLPARFRCDRLQIHILLHLEALEAASPSPIHFSRPDSMPSCCCCCCCCSSSRCTSHTRSLSLFTLQDRQVNYATNHGQHGRTTSYARPRTTTGAELELMGKQATRHASTLDTFASGHVQELRFMRLITGGRACESSS